MKLKIPQRLAPLGILGEGLLFDSHFLGGLHVPTFCRVRGLRRRFLALSDSKAIVCKINFHGVSEVCLDASQTLGTSSIMCDCEAHFSKADDIQVAHI